MEEKLSDQIGRYRLLQQIGEGGCGVVYMAEQNEPVRRRVALKVIKLGMDTRSIIARFEAERQALALMDHPNIAKVLDAGATETGRPFFVMELVRGLKITQYCDQHNLATRDRLALFNQVCQAVQHAHLKGIIHRDIKPSNILVALHDGVAVPKVIDFGIAKATTGQRLTDKTLFTAFEQFIGTPAYMSPEQAQMSSLDIDIRSDIYSLGVLLYELLTGKTPFDPEELLEAGLEEMRRIIREREPVRPSTRLNTLKAEEQTSIAQRRGSEPPGLIHLVRGDLDWIAMKCLEKDRTRRYESASDLASDIQRHLSDEPVVARPQSRLYKFERFARRHKLALAGCLAMVLLLAGAATFSIASARRARQAERQALDESEENQAMSEILEGALSRADPSAEKLRLALLNAADEWLKRAHPGDDRRARQFVLRMQEAVRIFAGAASLGSPGTNLVASSNVVYIAQPSANRIPGGTVPELHLRSVGADSINYSISLPVAALDETASPASKTGTGMILKGVLIIASTDQLQPSGAPRSKGVAVLAPKFLDNRDFEKELEPFLVRPLTFAGMARIQTKILDYCRRAGHPKA
jgi:serine/threonine protein kinase